MKQVLNKAHRVPECPSALAVLVPCECPSAKTPSECPSAWVSSECSKELKAGIDVTIEQKNPSEIFFKQKL